MATSSSPIPNNPTPPVTETITISPGVNGTANQSAIEDNSGQSAMEDIADQSIVKLCFICLEEIATNGPQGESGGVMRMNCCYNMICVACFSQHVSTQISGGVHLVTCPFCEHSLSHEQVMKVSNERNRKLLLRLKLINSLDPKTQKICPHCDFVQSAPSTLVTSGTGNDVSQTLVKCQQCGLR